MQLENRDVCKSVRETCCLQKEELEKDKKRFSCINFSKQIDNLFSGQGRMCMYTQTCAFKHSCMREHG